MVVHEVTEEEPTNAALARLRTENARLLDELQRLEELLRAAVELSAAMVQAEDPATVRHELLRRLVEDMGMAGAVLWCPAREHDDDLELIAAYGLPEEVRARVARLPASSLPGQLAAGYLARRVVPQGEDGWPGWPGCQLRLIAVPRPSSGVLGLYHQEPLPALVDGVLATLAHALAASVHQTTLHRRARTVVDALQRELVGGPAAVPAGVEVGMVYQSATQGVHVGGDFTDVLGTQNGYLGVACGDVSGKGVEAASLTAMAVYSMRAFALQGGSPSRVLTLLNAAVCEQTPEERFVTLAYARVDTQQWRGQIALAGHPTPLVVGPRGVTALDVTPQVPVGLLQESSYDDVEIALQPGEALVLYTDGVTEARRGGEAPGPLLGTEGLATVLEGLRGLDAQGVADGVWRAVQDWTNDRTTDDTAIVVLRRPADPQPVARS